MSCELGLASRDSGILGAGGNRLGARAVLEPERLLEHGSTDRRSFTGPSGVHLETRRDEGCVAAEHTSSAPQMQWKLVVCNKKSIEKGAQQDRALAKY